jgi:hypothetical protein
VLLGQIINPLHISSSSISGGVLNITMIKTEIKSACIVDSCGCMRTYDTDDVTIVVLVHMEHVK